MDEEAGEERLREEVDEAETQLMQREYEGAVRTSVDALRGLSVEEKAKRKEENMELPQLTHRCMCSWREGGKQRCLCERVIPVFMQARFELRQRFLIFEKFPLFHTLLEVRESFLSSYSFMEDPPTFPRPLLSSCEKNANNMIPLKFSDSTRWFLHFGELEECECLLTQYIGHLEER